VDSISKRPKEVKNRTNLRHWGNYDTVYQGEDRQKVACDILERKSRWVPRNQNPIDSAPLWKAAPPKTKYSLAEAAFQSFTRIEEKNSVFTPLLKGKLRSLFISQSLFFLATRKHESNGLLREYPFEENQL